MKYNILAEKSFAFSLRATRMYQYLLREKKEYVLSKQFVRAATSIGANIEEAIGALITSTPVPELPCSKIARNCFEL
jgi:four helix bundle protein